MSYDDVVSSDAASRVRTTVLGKRLASGAPERRAALPGERERAGRSGGAFVSFDAFASFDPFLARSEGAGREGGGFGAGRGGNLGGVGARQLEVVDDHLAADDGGADVGGAGRVDDGRD